MKKIHFFGALASLLLLLPVLPVANLSAQEADGHSSYTCGSDWARHLDYTKLLENTRRNDPALFERMVAQSKGIDQATVAGGETFFVIDQSTQIMQPVEATIVHEGHDALVWIADEYRSSVDQETIDRIIVGLEEKVKAGSTTRNANKGVIANDIDIYGEPVADKWSNGAVKLHILLLDIVSPVDGGVIEGYFSPYDQTTGIGSNGRNLLYVDLKKLVNGNSSSQEVVNDILGTIAHEFQHLINYSRYHGSSNKTHWIYNEGLSEVASIRNGYIDRDGSPYMSVTNQYSYFDAPMGASDINVILRGYERSMLWIHYLSERFGDEFLYELTAANGSNLEPVRKAMQATSNGSDAEKVMAEFWVANYIQGSTAFQGEGEYKYAYPVSSSAITVNKGGPRETLKADSVTVLGFAAYYARYANNKPDSLGLKIRFASAANPYKIHAVIFRPDQSIEVQPVTLDEDIVFGRFTNIVFVIANVGNSQQQVSWSSIGVEGNFSGVEDYATTRSVLAFGNVAPNPVRGEARFTFRTANPGTVRLDIFDMQGSMVLSGVKMERYSAGEETVTLDLSSLPAGVYTARLQDESGAMAVRQIVVVK